MTQYILEQLKKLNGKTFTIFALAVATAGIIYFYGCESKTCSLLDPSNKVTRTELNAEIAVIEARLQERTNDLDRQDALRKFIAEQASVVSTGGTVNPIGAINSLISIFAVGYAVDSKRKLSIANKKNSTTAT
jgi:hypothetical protein